MKDTFLMIDGNSLLHRAFHALPLMDAGGVYTNAIYGFLTMMLKAISDENARYLAVCFDEHAPTFRHTAYPDYKAGRAATPDELRQQFATIRTLLPEMGIQVFSLQGWEADDLLGTLSKLGEDAGVSPVILTGDRDALQLVSDTTQVLFTRKGISETTHFTPAMVYEVYGFSPEQVVDWKGLAGDSSDNIPGIPGVGDKTAVRLLHQYGTLDNILAHAGEVKGKLGEKLVTWADQAKMCRELATIRRDAPIAFSLKACAIPDFRHGIPALEKLKLNDASMSFTQENSIALGFGFRCGFLGLLHMEIITERLEREFDLDIITTTPSVRYRLTMTDGTVEMIDNPSSYPDPSNIVKQEEPFVDVHLYTPNDYVGALMDLCQQKRGVLIDMKYLDDVRVDLHYALPLGEIVYDFFDAIKSRSRGYASYDYEFKEYRESDLVKLDFLLNGDPVDALSMIVFRDNAYAKGRRICEKLRDNIPRTLFEIPVQAAIGGKIIARETVKAMRKDVLAKCYGGDITRKKKLLEKQKEGKKKMRQLGSVTLPSEAFTAVLKLDSDS